MDPAVDLAEGRIGVVQARELARAGSNPRIGHQLGDVAELVVGHAATLDLDGFRLGSVPACCRVGRHRASPGACRPWAGHGPSGCGARPTVGRVTYDVIVVGMGSVGSAAAYHLARRGRRVLGLERFGIPHALGSHHGAHRIYRFAYYEDPSYVPLMRAAHDQWLSLESAWGDPLLQRTGGLDIGRPDGEQVAGALASCRDHGLAHEVLDAAETARRFPAWRLPGDLVAVHQPDAGMVFPERCVSAHTALALRHGAEVHGMERVLGWATAGSRVRVDTEHARYEAGALVLCGGGWTPSLVPALSPLLAPTRQVVCWFAPAAPENFDMTAFPVWIALVDEGHFYGFPERVVPGPKIGWHDPGPAIDPDRLDRTATAADEAAHRAFVARYLPTADGPTLSRAACLYTMSPDEHFVLDTLPGHPNVAVFTGDSGHGFKFAPALGEALADLVTDGASRHDLARFRLDRFDVG